MNTDDPKLTAYVLGELSESDAVEVRTALETDAALRNEVEAIRETVAKIETAMRGEKLPVQEPGNTPGAHTPGSCAHAPKSRRRTRWILAVSLLILGGVALAYTFTALPHGQKAKLALDYPMKAVAPAAESAAKGVESEEMSDRLFTDAEIDMPQQSQMAGTPRGTLDVVAAQSGIEHGERRQARQAPVATVPAEEGKILKPTGGVTTREKETAFEQGDGKRHGRPGVVAQNNQPLNLDFARGSTSDGKSEASSESTMSLQGDEYRIDSRETPQRGKGQAAGTPFSAPTPTSVSSDANYGGAIFLLNSGQPPVAGRVGLPPQPASPEAPAASRPQERENPSGELVEEETDLFDEMEDVSSSAIDSMDAEAAWATGNRLPNREGIAMRGAEVVSMGGRKTPSRSRPEPGMRSRTYHSPKPTTDTPPSTDGAEWDVADGPVSNREGKPVRRPRISGRLFFDDPHRGLNREAYGTFEENTFIVPEIGKFSTFSIDVDTASYTTLRRYIESGQPMPKNAVRLEEMVNFFKYDYPQPTGEAPFNTHVDVVRCPWKNEHLLARIGIKGKELPAEERPALNLVFLIDVSGSMSSSNRLPLVKRGLTELVEMLQPKDRVAIVTYAGEAGLKLPSVSGSEKRAILDSIESLAAGGSTAGASGIKIAYETARKYFEKSAQNRVILCTDGDFNVGVTDNKTLEEMIAAEAKSGVFLTVLGFGMGNYKDERLKILSMHGNGNYGYVDSIDEARRLLVENLTGTLFAIAKDVKIQVDFNPARVGAYRLLGYENRKLRDEDFNDDTKDAGEIGAGHTVTALYEIVPLGVPVPQIPPPVDPSRYAPEEQKQDAQNEPQPVVVGTDAAKSRELLFVKLRYKEPEGTKSALLEYPVAFDADTGTELSPDMRFAASVALFGMLLRDSRYSGDGTLDTVLELAASATKDDKYRKEFVELVKKVKK